MGRLLALCASAHSMISVDTGPAHAAAALGLPLVVMFGGQPQAQWLPRSSSGSPVIGIGGPPTAKRLDEIPMSKVFETWLTLLAERRLRRPNPASPRQQPPPLLRDHRQPKPRIRPNTRPPTGPPRPNPLGIHIKHPQ